MMNCIFPIFLYFLRLSCAFSSRFDADELNSVFYDVSIENLPLNLDEHLSVDQQSEKRQEDAAESLIVANKNGQQYFCTLPTSFDGVDAYKRKLVQRRIENVKNLTLNNISDILDPFRKGACLFKTVGWWTYEFCYGVAIYQYHVEGKRIVDDKMVLGEFGFDEALNSTQIVEEFVERDRTFFHTQHYNNGSLCNINSNLRKTEVRFYCDENAFGATLQQVDEPSTCSYVLHVGVSTLCDLNAFRPAELQPPPLAVSCRPALKSSEFNEYAKQKDLADMEQKNAAIEKEKVKEELKKRAEESEASKKEEEQEEKLKTSDEEELKKMWRKFDAIVEQAVKDADPSSTLKVVDLNNLNVEDQLNAEIGASLISSADSSAEDSGETSDDEDAALLAEFEREFKKLAGKIVDRMDKSELRSQDDEQFDEIIEEARQDVSEEDDLTDDDATRTLTSTLNKLIDRLDRAEREIEMANQQLEEAEQKLTAASRNLENTLNRHVGEDPGKQATAEEEEIEEEKFESKRPKGRIQIKRQAAVDESEPAMRGGKENVKVRVSKINGKSTPMSEKALTKYAEETQKLEAKLAEKLQKAGLDTQGGQVQVKIITSGYYDEEADKFQMLTDAESAQFSNIILSLLGSDEKQKEEKRQKALEDNYDFRLKPANQ